MVVRKVWEGRYAIDGIGVRRWGLGLEEYACELRPVPLMNLAYVGRGATARLPELGMWLDAHPSELRRMRHPERLEARRPGTCRDAMRRGGTKRADGTAER